MFLPLRSVSDAPAVEAELKQIAAGHSDNARVLCTSSRAGENQRRTWGRAGFPKDEQCRESMEKLGSLEARPVCLQQCFRKTCASTKDMG